MEFDTRMCIKKGSAIMKNLELKCEYLTSPIGIQNKTPRFSWKLNNSNSMQIKYRILVSDSLEDIESDRGNMWDSGTVEENNSWCVEYQGRELQSKTKYFWKLILTLDDETVGTGISCFETALFHQSDWRGKWIQSPSPRYGVSPLFLKQFTLDKHLQDLTNNINK